MQVVDNLSTAFEAWLLAKSTHGVLGCTEMMASITAAAAALCIPVKIHRISKNHRYLSLVRKLDAVQTEVLSVAANLDSPLLKRAVWAATQWNSQALARYPNNEAGLRECRGVHGRTYLDFSGIRAPVVGVRFPLGQPEQAVPIMAYAQEGRGIDSQGRLFSLDRLNPPVPSATAARPYAQRRSTQQGLLRRLSR